MTAPDQVTFIFDQKGNRELPNIVGELMILPKHWWEGTDAKGNKRDISKGTLEPTLGSGPYRIADVKAGRSITYERVPDFWGKDLNVNVGSNNFDKISLRVLPRPQCRVRGVQGRRFRLLVGERGQALGDGLRLPGVHRRQGDEARRSSSTRCRA